MIAINSVNIDHFGTLIILALLFLSCDSDFAL